MRTGKEHRKSKSRGIMPLAFCVQDHLSQDKFCAKPCKRPLSDGTQALSAVTWLNLNLHRWPEGKGWQWKSQLMFLCPVANPIFWGEKTEQKEYLTFIERWTNQPQPVRKAADRHSTYRRAVTENSQGLVLLWMTPGLKGKLLFYCKEVSAMNSSK